MSDEKRIHGQKIYDLVTNTLDGMGWTYDRDDENLTINTGVKGEDLPIKLIIRVLPDADTLSVISPLPFNISEKSRVEAAIAVNVANYGLIRGSFDYDFTDGEVRFRIYAPFNDCDLSDEIVRVLILIAASTVEKYNDKFFMISKGLLTIQDFIKQENGED